MSEVSLSGSCLCEGVRYRVSGDSLGFLLCHCSRCRKASGTAHGSNILLKSDGVDWLSGEDSLGYYKVPDAKRYHTRFCTQCGSPVPRFHENLKLAVIPAGSLDEEPAVSPDAHIFWESRAGWSCQNPDLKRFAEYPSEE